MVKNNIISENEKIYYGKALSSLLKMMEDGKEHYTHHFEHACSYTFVGKDNRPLLRKCLRTLEGDGLVENIDLGTNIHKWKITEKGKNKLEIINNGI